jgi:penicillin-binding protein 1A
MKRWRRFISRCVLAGLSLLITMVIFLGAFYAYMELQLPNVERLRDVHMQVPLRVYTSDGQLISEYGSKRRIPIPLAQVPQSLIQAVLAVEDTRFYDHPGVDFISLVRAAKAVLTSGKKVQGASTITMQVARNFFLSRKKTYARKIKEILLALKIDKAFSKDKILELYLNKVYFGNRAYGVAVAAQVYYGKKLKELTLSQMAMLAGLPQAPSRNNPLRRPMAALKRRNHVLERMLEVKFIHQAAYEQAIRAPVTAKLHKQKSKVSASYLAEMVRQVLVAEYGKSAYDRGLSVTTTVSSRYQQAANLRLDQGLIAYSERHGYRRATQNWGAPSDENRLEWQAKLKKLDHIDHLLVAAVLSVDDKSAQALLSNGNLIRIPWSGLSWARRALRHGLVAKLPTNASALLQPGDLIWVSSSKKGWRLSQIPHIQGALVSMNPKNGAILALSGGFDYSLSNFNRVIQAMRQAGSSFKPFVYSAALAKHLTLATLINDAPIVLKDTGENALWRPNNDTLRFYGPTRLRVGLTKSRNLVSIRVLQATGIPFALDYIKRFGFGVADLPRTLSLALGAGLVTPLQTASGYAVFANGGYRVQPYFIAKIADSNGKILFQANPPTACEACIAQTQGAITLPDTMAERVINPQEAYLMTKALQGVIQHGTGHAARVLKRHDLAGKTGTTNDKVDAWFSGFNSDVVTTVWVGFDDSTSMHEYGAQAALPIWINYMRTALHGLPEHSMPQPPDMVTVRIDPKSGLLAEPSQRNAIFEVFRKENEPKKMAPISHMAASPVARTVGSGGEDAPLF